MQVGSSELSVYFIYAGPDEIRLAQMMGAGHSIFGIEMPWPLSWRDAAANNETAALPTMEQLVSPFVAALSTHARSSPCVLVGFSSAGMMAFEAAHQFKKLGGNVEMVMLIDTWARLRPPPHAAWSALQQRWKRTLDKVPVGRWIYLVGCSRSAWLVFSWMWRTKRMFRFLRRRSLELGELTAFLDEQGVPLHWELVARLYRKTITSYDLRLLDCRGVLFKTSEEYTRVFENRFAWQDLFAKGLEIVSVPGDHLGMMREHTLTLAGKVTEVLKRHFDERR